jgi:hypothetical protein
MAPFLELHRWPAGQQVPEHCTGVSEGHPQPPGIQVPLAGQQVPSPQHCVSGGQHPPLLHGT